MLARQLKSVAAAALVGGGIFWMLTYVVFILVGVTTGEVAPDLDASSPLVVRVGIWFLPLSTLPLAVGLLGLFVGADGRSRALARIGAIFASVALVLALSDLVNLSEIFGFSDSLNGALGGFSAFAVSIGAGFMGWSMLRASTPSRQIAWPLVVIGISTIPVLFATPLPVGPDWASDALAFLLSGMLFTFVGLRLTAASQAREARMLIVGSPS
jgi:hypothetical protein